MPAPLPRPRAAATPAGAGSPPPWESTPTGLRCEWHLESRASSVTALRWWLRVFLGQARGVTSEEIDDLVLAACEAASNAVDHPLRPSKPYFAVCTEIDRGVVTIVIQDHGRWRPPTAPGSRGRGLQLMRALADTSVTTGPGGTTVTLRHPPLARAAGDEPQGLTA